MSGLNQVKMSAFKESGAIDVKRDNVNERERSRQARGYSASSIEAN